MGAPFTHLPSTPPTTLHTRAARVPDRLPLDVSGYLCPSQLRRSVPGRVAYRHKGLLSSRKLGCVNSRPAWGPPQPTALGSVCV